MTKFKSISNYFKGISTTDLRSLALFRILMAFMVMLDLLNRLPDIRVHYTDFGFLPRQIMITNFDDGRMVLHLLNGSTWFELLLFAIHFIFAFSLFCGYRTRLSSFLVWILSLSLTARNPPIAYASDVLLRNILLWGIFLPLGARFSLDRFFHTKETQVSNQYHSPAVLGLMLQIASVYIFTAIFKEVEPSWQNGQGVYNALSIDAYATEFGVWMSHQWGLVYNINYITLAFEFLAPILLFIPWKKNLLRLPLFLGFVGLHLGMGAGLCVWFFQCIAITAWTSMLPAVFWNKIKLKGLASRLTHFLQTKLKPYIKLHSRSLIYTDGKFLTALPYLFIGMALYWNIWSLDRKKVHMPLPLENATLALGIDQQWNMFAQPFSKAGWFLIPAKLANGANVDIYTGGAPIDWTKPERISNTFRNERWRKFMTNLLDDNADTLRLNYARYLCRSWDEDHPAPGAKLQVFKIVYRRQQILPNGEKGKPDSSMLWQHECKDGMLAKWGAEIKTTPDGE